MTTATVSPNTAIRPQATAETPAAAALLSARSAAAGRPLSAVTGAEIQAPLIQGGHVRYANLDYGASAPALSVVSAYLNEILPFYASVHRGAGYASQISTSVYENARNIVREFVGGRTGRLRDLHQEHHGFTEPAGRLPSAADGRPAGDVLYLDIEHHANLLPWQGVPHRSVVAADTLTGTIEALRAELQQGGVSLLAVTGASNVTGEILPIRALAALAHEHGARIVVDAAQLAPHRRDQHQRRRRRLPRLLRPQAVRAVRRRRPGGPDRLARRRNTPPGRRRRRPGSAARRRQLGHRTGPA